jgi:hypothetical protein
MPEPLPLHFAPLLLGVFMTFVFASALYRRIDFQRATEDQRHLKDKPASKFMIWGYLIAAILSFVGCLF